MPRVTVQITQDDIKYGRRYWPSAGPVARAIYRATGAGVVVGCKDALLAKPPLPGEDKARTARVALPPEILELAQAFNRAGPCAVAPASFPLDLPEGF